MTIDTARLRALAEAVVRARELYREVAEKPGPLRWPVSRAWANADEDFHRAVQVDAILALLDERAALAAMLRRLRAWDMLDVAGDGAYWKREIDAALAARGKEPQRVQCPQCRGSGVGEYVDHGHGPDSIEPIRCDKCDGFGWLAAPPAPSQSKLERLLALLTEWQSEPPDPEADRELARLQEALAYSRGERETVPAPSHEAMRAALGGGK
jgi:hypothetical protein